MVHLTRVNINSFPCKGTSYQIGCMVVIQFLKNVLYPLISFIAFLWIGSTSSSKKKRKLFSMTVKSLYIKIDILSLVQKNTKLKL